MPVEIPAKDIVVKKANEAATIAVEQAEQASKDGTFGVGGLMVDNATGKVLAIARNHVIQNGQVVDPTGHVERQLVDWYYEQTQKGAKLPQPENITIVSSLDPCVMCGGGILETKFNVISVAKDDFAGVTFKGLGDFTAIPAALRETAAKQMAYFGVESDKTRPYNGPKDSIFAGQTIAPELLARSNAAFGSSLERVKGFINAYAGVGPDKLKNIDTLKEGDKLLDVLKKYTPNIQTLKVDPSKTVSKELGEALLKEAGSAQKNGGKLNAAALIGPDGHVLHIASGKEGQSPIRSAFMELTRDYAKMRKEAGKEGVDYLPHPKHCKIVLLCGPGPTTTDFMQLGAVGSTMEGPVPDANSNWLQYIVPTQPQRELDKMSADLPTLYSKVIKIAPTQCADVEGVREHCEAMVEALKKANNATPKQENIQPLPPKPEPQAMLGRAGIKGMAL